MSTRPFEADVGQLGQVGRAQKQAGDEIEQVLEAVGLLSRHDVTMQPAAQRLAASPLLSAVDSDRPRVWEVI